MTALEAMKRENNIIGFRDNSCYGAIRAYLNNKKKGSKNTYDACKRYFNEFFQFVYGRNLSDITWEDILNIKYNDVIYFREYLQKNKDNSDKTINQKVSTLLPLFKELKKHNNKIDPSIVDVPAIPVEEVEEVIGSDALTPEEAYGLLEFAKQQSYKGFVQYVFYKTAISTSLRKESLLTATVDNLKQIKDRQTNEMYWCVVVTDKGKRQMIKPITDELYEEIMELQSPLYRANLKSDNGRLFPISQQKLVETLKLFCSEYGINRDITLHSLRKTSADYANELVGGDIKKIQQQTGHKNPKVLINTYQGTRATLHSFPGLNMFQENDNMEKLEELTKEELIDLIKQCDYSVARQLLGKLNKIREA